MNKTNKITIAVCSIITVIAVSAMGIFLSNSINDTNQYKQQLNYTYQNNFYSLTDDINNIETNLSKLSVATNEDMQEKYLTEIVSLCESAQNSLSSLPIEHNSISETYKFVNQLGGYCFTLHQKILKNEKITLDDIDQMENLYESASEIKYELNRLAEMINSGYSIIDNIQNPSINSNNFSSEFNGIYNDTIEYPSLIYDGPFSDSVENKEVKGLPEDSITQTEAELRMQKWFNGWDITSSGETKGEIATWNFVLEQNGNNGYAQVTQKGGILLQFGTDISTSESYKTTKECEIIAKQFADSVGIKNVDIVWSTDCDGFVYCNLAYTQKDVIIYPDMIKVKVSKSGDIVGWEAKSWVFNHIKRTDLTPTLSKSIALSKIESNLDVLTTKLCVVPAEYVGENLAWEFKCIRGDSIYYIYIDAHNGSELNVMKVIETDNGELLM